MKTRHGFVSNSSSSSFICEICGEHAEGMDLCLSECDMFYCINGHTMCDEHALKELTCGGKTREEWDNLEYIEEDKTTHGEFDLYEIDEECCPICSYKELSYEDAKRYLLETTEYTTVEVFAEIKKVNSRRKKLYAEEYVKYVFDRLGLTDEAFLVYIKDKFPKYEDYRMFKKENV